MKTAISVKDALFKRVDKFAKRKKMSRSQLFSDAVEEYLDKREDPNEESLIERINAVCAEVDTSVDPVWKRYQFERLKRSGL
jgi:metal-responsive CopG/Arc/MetJ family transcriptional regulator